MARIEDQSKSGAGGAGLTSAAFCERRSLELMSEGLKHASKNMYDLAANRFKASLRLQKSAEAYTYWAWMESMKQNFSVAIHLCREAIQLDPDYGNPYNDIGSYHVAIGKWDEALEWFERAKKAKNYTCRHYPYLNAARLYKEKGDYWRAISEYKSAQKIAPEDQSIRAEIRDLESKLS